MSESIIYEVTTTNSIHKLGMYGIWSGVTPLLGGKIYA